WNEARRQVALRYNELLAGLPGLVLPEVSEGHVFHQYTVRVLGGKRDEVRRALEAQGIGTMVYYPIPLHRLPPYAPRGFSLPEADRASGEVLSLPMGPTLDAESLGRVREALWGALKGL
ncbi:DegT/DnrJ/EryC1/StrS family aminotransferase, partial [Fervidobacterium sp.]